MRPTLNRRRVTRTGPELRVSVRRHALQRVNRVERVVSKPARAHFAPFADDIGSFGPDPHVDYARVLTPEGGIAITYKDIDGRFRHVLGQVTLWIAMTGYETWMVFNRSPVQTGWVNWVCLAAVAVINWLIVFRPVEIQRTIEIRPDCMIIEGEDIFWVAKMESWPTFTYSDGRYVLCGTYGTRYVEYLAAQRTEEMDRTPDVLALHLRQAMQQMWTRPQI
jgi:hypothetical protein